jgi:hypothetical protein
MAFSFLQYYLLKEDIKHNLIWVYHRTKTHPDEHALTQGLFNKDVNERATYGKGLYTTFDIESQQGPNMKATYGPYILRLKVNIEKYCILDPDVFEILHPQKTQSRIQHRDFWKYVYSLKLNIPPPSQNEDDFGKPFYGSDLAYRNHETIRKLGFSGIIFNGRQDGKVTVIWKPETLTIHSYSTDDGQTWTPIKPKPLKENNEFENTWIVYKKTGKCPKLTFDVFEKFSDWLIKRLDASEIHPTPVREFFQKDENHINLLKLIRKDAENNSKVRFQLINAIEPIDLWDLFLEFNNRHMQFGVQLVSALITRLKQQKVPEFLYDEIPKELSMRSYGQNGRYLLSHITGEFPNH